MILLMAAIAAMAQTPSLAERTKAAREAANKDQPKARRVYTQDDLAKYASPGDPPHLPGMLLCGADVQCFLDAIDKGIPVGLARRENSTELSADITAAIAWWVTSYEGNKCTVNVRLDEFRVVINEERAAKRPQEERAMIARRILEAEPEFEKVRGKENACVISRRNLRTALTGKSFSLNNPVFHPNSGTECTGLLFESFNPKPRPKVAQ